MDAQMPAHLAEFNQDDWPVEASTFDTYGPQWRMMRARDAWQKARQQWCNDHHQINN